MTNTRDAEDYVVMRINERTDEWDQLSIPLCLDGAKQFKGWSETTYKGEKIHIFKMIKE